jgi:hypothetical protein
MLNRQAEHESECATRRLKIEYKSGIWVGVCVAEGVVGTGSIPWHALEVSLDTEHHPISDVIWSVVVQ